MKKYYTYAYLREDRTPYYIGKGQKNRAYRKDRKRIKRPKDDNRILILKKNLTEEEAFKHEIYMIGIFGRKDLGTGILLNMTNGGEGTSGFKMFFSEEHKQKLKNSAKGREVKQETREKLREKFKNRKFSPETREKMSRAKKGVPKSKESNEKRRESNLKRPKESFRKYIYTFISPTGELTETDDVISFCKENNLTHSKVYATSRGLYNHHKGWKVSRRLK
jgi:hypothetical protein